MPPPLPPSAAAAERVVLTRSSPPPPPPPGSLPPRYRPPIPDEEDDADTLIENLEDDSFEMSLRGDLAPPRKEPNLEQIVRMLEVSVTDVLERIDEAMLSMTEQRVVRPLYLIGGAVAVRAMVVPALVLFLAGVFVGMPSADRLRKTFPKAEPQIVAAATAPVVVEAPPPEAATPEAVEAPVEAAPVAAPAEPQVTDAQREARRRRWRARRMRRARVRRAQARQRRAQARRAQARRARRARARRARR